ncbi:MAG: hypoxanthine phosphoribosyltransferase [Chloroflexota bacterium]|nr:MAG: hypoxanthine phosphoribosyltransferase [Chloroflexota bacterium]
MREPVDGVSVLIDAKRLRDRIESLAREIEMVYDGLDLHLICVLKGATFFMVDLARALRCPVSLDFIGVSSYGGGARSSGIVRITKDLDISIEGRDVLIVEDIVDTGLTLAHMRELLMTREPRSLRVCALLDKREARLSSVPIDFVGFTIPNSFVVGYGLDYTERYRELPYVGVLEPSRYQGESSR